jgi:hypothetical protein
MLIVLLSAAIGIFVTPKPEELVSNPGFERVETHVAVGWAAFGQGYEVVSDVRRTGRNSIRCRNISTQERRGATYTLILNQSMPRPLLVTGWSRAENVGGTANNDYSIYLDLEFTDGSPLWGQTAPFAVGTHDWQRRQVLIVPPKPIRRVAIHALFRHHTGTAWFDDFLAMELTGDRLFDSQPIMPPRLPLGATQGWFARDVAQGTEIQPLLPALGTSDFKAQELHLRLSHLRADAGGRILMGRLEDTSGKPRAVTLYYVERFDAPNAIWWNDIRHRLRVRESGEYTHLTRIGVGATGSLSLYPLGCVTGNRRGRVLGVPPLLGPRIVRIGYHAREKLFYVAFDLALTGENIAYRNEEGCGFAEVGIVRYSVHPTWGFREAAQRYYRLFPEVYTRRAKAEGIWIPFTDPAQVENVGDFGIAYHEGDNSVASDDKLGILSFRYTEPMSYWMPMAPEIPRTYEEALAMVHKDASGTDEHRKRWAQAVLLSGSYDERGKFNVEFQNAPWTNGAVWILNPNPHLPHPPDTWTKARLSYTQELADTLYGTGTTGTLDGEYLDSIEGWADVLDFRPESLRYSPIPPTFTTDTHQPVIPTWFSVYALAKYMHDDLHRRGKLLMANATPWRIHAFAPLLDVMGTETNWQPGGRWQPDSDAVFNLRRTLSYQKPYLLLQNTDFDAFGPVQVEKYFQRSMFYGVYPSMFSIDASTNPYWTITRWYNRDRPLFKKYIPVIKRLSEAGWEPITYARADNPQVYVERFGREYITVLNDSPREAKATLTIEAGKLLKTRRRRAVRVVNVITGDVVTHALSGETIRVSLALKPEEARALRIEPL